MASTSPHQPSPVCVPLGHLCHLALHHLTEKSTEGNKILNYNKQQRHGKGEMQQSRLQAQFSDHKMDRGPLRHTQQSPAFPTPRILGFSCRRKLRLLASSIRGLCFGLKILNTSSSLPLEGEAELEGFVPSDVKSHP